jgi:hypothetical protein
MVDQAQAFQALELANRNRVGAAVVRRELAAGAITVAAALKDPRSGCMPVGRLLCARRGWGPTKTNELLEYLGIFATRRVRDLTVHEREWIVRAAR